MAWSELTDSEIKSRLSHAEVEAIEETGGGDDRLPGIIDQVTELVRSRVAACSRNTMGTAGTIPAECKHAAAAIARHNLINTVPTGYTITEERENEYRDALQFLDKVADCKVGIAGADGTIDGRAGGSYGGRKLLNF